MAEYITHLDVSLYGAEEENLQALGFTKINVNLNEEAGGNFIYLWYKTEQGSEPITRLQVTFSDDMTVGLINAGYTKIDKNLNTGTPKGDQIYLWYFNGKTQYDTPIAGINVSTNVQKEAFNFENNWERVACDLNRNAGGNWIHIWMKREKQTYIRDVTATDTFGSDTNYFQQGYIRLDEDTNRGAGGAKVFIWYRLTTDPRSALTGLNVSTNSQEAKMLKQQNYEQVSVDLNKLTGGSQVYLWYKKQEGEKPIKVFTLLTHQDAVNAYQKVGVTVIPKNLNTGNTGLAEYLCFHQ